MVDHCTRGWNWGSTGSGGECGGLKKTKTGIGSIGLLHGGALIYIPSIRECCHPVLLMFMTRGDRRILANRTRETPNTRRAGKPNSEFAILEIDDVLSFSAEVGSSTTRWDASAYMHPSPNSRRSQTLESMSQATAQSRQRSSSFRSWSTFFTPKPKPHSDALEILDNTPHISGSHGGTTPSPSSSYSSGSESMGTTDVRSDDPPSYAHAVSRGKPASYRFVQDSPFSMNLMAQDEPPNIAYNISVGVNVWMPSEHITLLRRHANTEGPVLARLE